MITRFPPPTRINFRFPILPNDLDSQLRWSIDFMKEMELLIQILNKPETVGIVTVEQVPGLSPIGSANTILGVNMAGNAIEYKAFSGTANQIIITKTPLSFVFSLPQNIHAGATPTFLGLILSAMAQGSVLFIGASGALSQDNTNFFWDNTNKRLGIGTATPSEKLHIAGGNLKIVDSANAGGFIFGFNENHGIYFREGNLDATNYYSFGGSVIDGKGHRFLTGGAKASQALRFQIGNNAIYSTIPLGIGVTIPLSDIHIKKSTNPSIRLEHTGATKQVVFELFSNNTAEIREVANSPGSMIIFDLENTAIGISLGETFGQPRKPVTSLDVQGVIRAGGTGSAGYRGIAGSATNPLYRFDGTGPTTSEATGLFKKSTGVLGITCSGVERASVSSAGIRSESDVIAAVKFMQDTNAGITNTAIGTPIALTIHGGIITATTKVVGVTDSSAGVPTALNTSGGVVTSVTKTTGVTNTAAGVPTALNTSSGIVTSISKTTPVADGTYTVGARLTPSGTDGRITVTNGIITAIQEAT